VGGGDGGGNGVLEGGADEAVLKVYGGWMALKSFRVSSFFREAMYDEIM
jgi:hypothetical protein